uniref:Transposase n=1 Tax=Steinernema glaseri TaxID=37863 RepID=A0A1I8ALP9_9BILA
MHLYRCSYSIKSVQDVVGKVFTKCDSSLVTSDSGSGF